jgi:hypothetical protein
MQNQHKWSVLAVSQTLVDRIFRFEFNLDASKVLFLVNMMCRKKAISRVIAKFKLSLINR